MLGNKECDCDHRIGEPHDEECQAFGEGEGEYEDGLQANDVFIVEGRQERYGSKRAWELMWPPNASTSSGTRVSERCCVSPVGHLAKRGRARLSG